MMIAKLLFTALLWRQAQSQTISTNTTDNNQTTATQQQPTNNNVIIYPRHLTFQELQRLISSEIGVEYNYYNNTTGSANNNNIEETLEEDWESTITESTWNASVQYEWSKALSSEYKDGGGSS
jgi:phosphoribosylaminoimidazole (AIR) synthetase